MQKADTEYLAREIASLRIAVGEVSTRDFVRSELSRLAEELDEAAQRRYRLERKDRQKAARRAERTNGDALDDPVDAGTYDEDAAPPPARRHGR